MPFLPRPPASKNMVDFVVLVFVLTVSTILLIAVVGVGILAIIDEDSALGPIVNSIADIMTTIIGALIGYIAGKGQGHIEARDRELEMKKIEQGIKIDDA